MKDQELFNAVITAIAASPVLMGGAWMIFKKLIAYHYDLRDRAIKAENTLATQREEARTILENERAARFTASTTRLDETVSKLESTVMSHAETFAELKAVAKSTEAAVNDLKAQFVKYGSDNSELRKFILSFIKSFDEKLKILNDRVDGNAGKVIVKDK